MIVPEDRWSRAREKWRRTEALGFDHAWTYDHLNWRAFKDRDWFTLRADPGGRSGGDDPDRHQVLVALTQPAPPGSAGQGHDHDRRHRRAPARPRPRRGR